MSVTKPLFLLIKEEGRNLAKQNVNKLPYKYTGGSQKLSYKYDIDILCHRVDKCK